MKLLKISILTATVAAVATAAAITAYRDVPTYAEPNIDTAHSCASIHFGMSDDTLTGYVCSPHGTKLYKGVENSSLVSTLAKEVEIESFKITSDSLAEGSLLVAGGDYKVGSDVHYATNTHGLKLGSTKNGATLSITLFATAIGCDIYAVGWNEDGISISVNGSESVSVPKNVSVAGNPAPETLSVTYNKYSFAFDASDTITIVTVKRAIIGDIAFRLQ